MKEIDLVRNHEKSLPFLQQLEEESGQKSRSLLSVYEVYRRMSFPLYHGLCAKHDYADAAGGPGRRSP